MTRDAYLAAALHLYRAAPDGAPPPTPTDREVAATLYDRGVPLEHLAHAIRLATLRRHAHTHPPAPVRSLAYYRAVLERLTPDELDADYIRYVQQRFQQTYPDAFTQPPTQTAASPPDSRGL